jgi:pseudouridylate synthase
LTLRLSRAVAKALEAGRPVVALETSVVAQGLPHPRNLEAAFAMLSAVRDGGAEPAVIAVLDGTIRVGLSDRELDRLGDGREPMSKVGARDLAAVMASGASGGTTVSAVCEVAARFGIRVFATGGIGGVHRGASDHFDISQDLGAIAARPVAVVCAGAKTVLDLPKTLELLETLGVPVVGVGTLRFPGFFVRETDLTLEHRVGDATQGAAWMRLRFDTLGQGGMIFALPPPAATSLSGPEVERFLTVALADAKKKGIRGKAVTPFLLSALVAQSRGRTLEANVALLVHNARFAAELAVAYALAPKKRTLKTAQRRQVEPPWPARSPRRRLAPKVR